MSAPPGRRSRRRETRCGWCSGPVARCFGCRHEESARGGHPRLGTLGGWSGSFEHVAQRDDLVAALADADDRHLDADALLDEREVIARRTRQLPGMPHGREVAAPAL